MNHEKNTKLRIFETLTPAEKIKAILGTIVEAIPKEAAFEWADLEYTQLSNDDQEKIDAIFSSAQVIKHEMEHKNELRYMLNSADKKELEKEIDLTSVRKQMLKKIKAKIELASK